MSCGFCKRVVVVSVNIVTVMVQILASKRRATRKTSNTWT